MKNLKVIAALVSTLLISLSSQAADRCEGKAPTSLLQAEAVANFYFDMKLHELICTYKLKGAPLQVVFDKVLAARTLLKANIIAAQDKMVAHLGSEAAFETYFARIGNHLSYLNLPNPCERAVEIADMMTGKKPANRAKIAKLYKPHFEFILEKYEAKSSRPFTRVCEPLAP